MIISSVEKNIIENTNNLENITIWGTKAGQGKTRYAISKIAERLIKDETVLFFSTENTPIEVLRRIAETIDNLGHDSNTILRTAKIKIYNSYEMNDDYIIKMMRTQASSEDGLDFVVIDHLHLANGLGGNYNEIVKIHNKLDREAIDLKCEVLITTQLNANA